nr:DUF2007 domain-containing protein [Vibrio ziniensis]
MKIFIAQHPTEAHIVCGLLRQQNIPCEVRGETLFSVRGEIPFDEASSPYVWLLNLSLLEQSEQVISDYLQPAFPNQPDWVCKHCGENNEPQFGLCWNCGYESI